MYEHNKIIYIYTVALKLIKKGDEFHSRDKDSSTQFPEWTRT